MQAKKNIFSSDEDKVEYFTEDVDKVKYYNVDKEKNKTNITPFSIPNPFNKKKH